MIELIKYMLDKDEANSRFVFLLQGIATSIAIVVVTVAFVMTESPILREGYDTVLMTLLGGGSLLSATRALSKKSGKSKEKIE